MPRPPIARHAEQVELYTALPDDIPKEVWGAWPRKADAHLFVAVPRRMVTSRVLKGVLTVYSCPDDSVRIPSPQLEKEFGAISDLKADASKRPPVPGRERKGLTLSDAELELDDPIVGMFRECRVMLREEREHTRAVLREEREHFRLQLQSARDANEKQLKLLVDPIGAATLLLQESSTRLAARVVFLEERQDAVIAERELMADFRQERDVQIEALRAKEHRRNEVLQLLKRELGPALISKLGLSGADSLAGFISNMRPELVELLINSGELTPDQQKILRGILDGLRAKATEQAAEQAQSAAGAAPAAPAATTSNGAAGAHSEGANQS